MTFLIILVMVLVFFSFLAELFVVKPFYEVGTKLYCNMCGKINFTQVYEVVSFENGQYLIKCIKGKDIFGKDIVYESSMSLYAVQELFVPKDFIDEEYGIDILNAQKQYRTLITLNNNK